jgi:hypothetical protein
MKQSALRLLKVNYEVSLDCFKLCDTGHHLDAFLLIVFVHVTNVSLFVGHY